MQKHDSWLLQEGIDEVLPDQAETLERLRRKLLDTFSNWGVLTKSMRRSSSPEARRLGVSALRCAPLQNPQPS